MRVLMCGRRNLCKLRAGDTVQVMNTFAELRGMGVEIDVVDGGQGTAVSLRGYDIVHFFNLMCASDLQQTCEQAKSLRLPVVLSPVYWNPGRFFREEGASGTYSPAWWKREAACGRSLVEAADVLLPNAETEMRQIERDFGVKKRYVVVPNAASPLFACGNAELFRARYGLAGDFILSVGRISPRKNQLRLIRACRGLNLPLVVIGPTGDHEYLRECRREAGSNVTFLGELEHRLLADAYAAARVHCLASWYDTPGLASLEAALGGCQLVVSKYGTAREYFGNRVFYCSPANIDEICESLRRAWVTPPDPGLRQLVATKYTWKHAAKLTLSAYRMVTTSM